MADRTYTPILTKIMAALTGSSTLAAVVGSGANARIYQAWPPGPPSGTVYPILVVWPESMDSEDRVDQGPTSVFSWVSALEAAAYSPDTLRTIDGALNAALDFAGFTSVTGWTNVTAEITGSTAPPPEIEGKSVLHRRVWTLRVTAQPA